MLTLISILTITLSFAAPHKPSQSELASMTDAEFHAYMVDRIMTETKPGSDKRRWRLESLEFTERCPNGYYDRANDIDVCE